MKTSPELLAKAFGLGELPPDLGARYNIAPSQDVLAVPNQGPPHAEVFRWGLVPYWAKDAAVGNKLANARGESLAEKPSFREALRRRRCLVLADGFYEWRTDGTGKTPYHFRLPDGAPFAMAGLWETWRAPGSPPDAPRLHTCCLITTDANAVVGQLHDRMPVILPPEDWARWLQPGQVEPAEVTPLLRPYAGAMEAVQVSRYVNRAGQEGPQCIEPAPTTGLLL